MRPELLKPDFSGALGGAPRPRSIILRCPTLRASVPARTSAANMSPWTTTCDPRSGSALET